MCRLPCLPRPSNHCTAQLWCAGLSPSGAAMPGARFMAAIFSAVATPGVGGTRGLVDGGGMVRGVVQRPRRRIRRWGGSANGGTDGYTSGSGTDSNRRGDNSRGLADGRCGGGHDGTVGGGGGGPVAGGGPHARTACARQWLASLSRSGRPAQSQKSRQRGRDTSPTVTLDAVQARLSDSHVLYASAAPSLAPAIVCSSFLIGSPKQLLSLFFTFQARCPPQGC